MSTRHIEKSHGVEGGGNEMNVEGEGDREVSDVSHTRGVRFSREEREGIGGENERKSQTGCEGMDLDAKTGLLTGLLTGIQDWKCPVALSQTCYGSKSLKVILMDSNFGGHPVLNPLVTM
jgi:hypothetical protein